MARRGDVEPRLVRPRPDGGRGAVAREADRARAGREARWEQDAPRGLVADVLREPRLAPHASAMAYEPDALCGHEHLPLAPGGVRHRSPKRLPRQSGGGLSLR